MASVTRQPSGSGLAELAAGLAHAEVTSEALHGIRSDHVPNVLPHQLPDHYVSEPLEHIVKEAAGRLVEDHVKDEPAKLSIVELRANLPTVARAPLAYRLVAGEAQALRTDFARSVYKPTLLAGRHILKLGAEFFHAYVGTHPQPYNFKLGVLQKLRETGTIGAAYGHEVPDGLPVVISKLIATRAGLQDGIGTQVAEIGHDMQLPDGTVIPIAKARQSLMIGQSGMSFPQLSARAVLTLVFANAALAEKGVHYLANTGEGGTEMHLALLTGDREGLRRMVVGWGQKIGQLGKGTYDQAKVEVFIDQLMNERDKLFATLGPDAVKNAQVTAQFGSAFNGIHDEHGNIDFAMLQHVGEHPNVAMIEFKLKQAAKRGSKVDAAKMDAIAASIREQKPGERAKSPALNPEVDSYEDIATLVVATRLATRKPVSLKFAVGDVENIAEFLEYLSAMGALPDHIQIDGAGKNISPGSGNAPPTGAGGDSSLTAREGLIAVDTILKHLNVRDRVFVQVAGEVMLPTESLEAMALGADGTLGARTWLVMGVGCKGARKCDSGACPYGIASKQGNIFSNAVNPLESGPAAVKAALDWREHLLVEATETGTVDWRTFRKTHGLHAKEDTLGIRQNGLTLPLRKVYNREMVHDVLSRALRSAEIDQAVYGYAPPEYVEHQQFDAERRASHYYDGRLSRDPAMADAVAAFKADRIAQLRELVASGAEHHDVRDFIRNGIPPELLIPVSGKLSFVGLS